MKFVADLHLHSAYSRATSKSLNFDTLSEWAKWKGVGLLSSADFTHPGWFREIKIHLKENGEGLYEYNGVKFILGSEISCIYSQGGKVRRIHCLLYFPKISDVEKFNQILGKRANLAADGRPIIGLSARDLLDLALSVSEQAILIPAHVWTPWFSLYGSNSGLDSIEECFGDLSRYIYAIETGLSSDPAMNWRVKDLDSRSIVSFSDAHSAPKMGRELTIFDSEFSYDGLLKALKSERDSGADHQFVRLQTTRDKSAKSNSGGLVARSKGSLHKLDQPQDQNNRESRILMTVEFFPEEGKYHYTGHRNCDVRHSPEETAKYGIICPRCSRKLTVGVRHRVEQLSEKNRPEGYRSEDRPGYKMMVPLLEILSEALSTSVASQKVRDEYYNLIKEFGSEMSILLKTDLTDIDQASTYPRVSEAIRKVREGNINLEPGYDGVFGVVKIFPSKVTTTSDGGGRKPVKKPATILKKAKGQIGLFE